MSFSNSCRGPPSCTGCRCERRAQRTGDPGPSYEEAATLTTTHARRAWYESLMGARPFGHLSTGINPEGGEEVNRASAEMRVHASLLVTRIGESERV